MAIVHNLGFPRIGAQREMKEAVEAYWKGKIDQAQLQETGRDIRKNSWKMQAALNMVPVNDFSWYDHVLDMSALLGVIPPRFEAGQKQVDLDTYFHMARGRAPGKEDEHACAMKKWFDTNYHYIVPEFHQEQSFKISCNKLFDETAEAKSQGYQVKPVLLGPLSYLWLGKIKDSDFNKLDLLKKLIPVYREILMRLASSGVEWIQIDEPILVLDLPKPWQQAFLNTYEQLQIKNLKILLATYFGSLQENTAIACQLPVAGLHIDAVRAPEQIPHVLKQLRQDAILSVGIIDGRNIWRTDLKKALEVLKPLQKQLGDRLWVSASSSLLHSPVDLAYETALDPELKNWLAFAKQKVDELTLVAKALKTGEGSIQKELKECEEAMKSRRNSKRIHNPKVKQRVQSITQEMIKRSAPHAKRSELQRNILNLPTFPTTTVGSFPQTQEIRAARRDFKLNKIQEQQYNEKVRAEIKKVVQKQEELGLDVLVHGEAERNDMVEYFGELLEGYAFTQNGWVQSYGSRCVKPPIIYGDVQRPKQMTIDWICYAQSLTKRPVKGMLTGPITMLCWSFVRDDQPHFDTAKQISCALRDEVIDLERAGVKVIQIDEPAFREGLPLRHKAWQDYLQQAVECFKIASCGVKNETQIHTHMCYAEFNDIIDSIAALDADVITIETSRSDMELLRAFEKFRYPNEIGPGVYDIHSPRVPSVDEMVDLIEKAVAYIPIHQLWINPDCGLKTRGWPETEASLQNMVKAAKQLRNKYSERAIVS